MTVLEPIGCPICGEAPQVDREGTWMEISCCVSMSWQKCDYLTMEERQTWSEITHSRSPEVEDKVFNMMVNHWNTRSEISNG